MSLFNRTIFALVLALACNACVFGFDTSFEAGGAGDDADSAGLSGLLRLPHVGEYPRMA